MFLGLLLVMYRLKEIELYTVDSICLRICLECGGWEVSEGEKKKRQLTDRLYCTLEGIILDACINSYQ